VSTSSRVEKKVDRSGRRGGGSGLCSLESMLCSTAIVSYFSHPSNRGGFVLTLVA
jgi:hypothetical protein